MSAKRVSREWSWLSTLLSGRHHTRTGVSPSAASAPIFRPVVIIPAIVPQTCTQLSTSGPYSCHTSSWSQLQAYPQPGHSHGSVLRQEFQNINLHLATSHTRSIPSAFSQRSLGYWHGSASTPATYLLHNAFREGFHRSVLPGVGIRSRNLHSCRRSSGSCRPPSGSCRVRPVRVGDCVAAALNFLEDRSVHRVGIGGQGGGHAATASTAGA